MNSTSPAADDTADQTGPTGTAAAIAADRALIDDLDRRIIVLIRERAAASARIQRARMASGGRRLELTREMDILERYRDGLGEPGRRVATSVLELCRGRA